MTHGDLGAPATSLSVRASGGTAFALAPLPNQIFTRDSSAWIHDRQAVAGLATAARRRERLHLAVIYRHHPLLAGPPVTQDAGRTGVEGGDVIVASPECVLIGMGQRTTAAAVERLARELLEQTPVREILAVAIPHVLARDGSVGLNRLARAPRRLRRSAASRIQASSHEMSA